MKPRKIMSELPMKGLVYSFDSIELNEEVIASGIVNADQDWWALQNKEIEKRREQLNCNVRTIFGMVGDDSGHPIDAATIEFYIPK